MRGMIADSSAASLAEAHSSTFEGAAVLSDVTADDLLAMQSVTPDPPNSVYWINVDTPADIDRWVSNLGISCLTSPRIEFVFYPSQRKEMRAHIRKLIAAVVGE